MPAKQPISHFKTSLHRPAGGDGQWAFLLVPKEVSETLPRRGRCTVEGVINGHAFQSTLEPDGQLGHWLKVTEGLRSALGAEAGDLVDLELGPVAEEPEPVVPADLEDALEFSPEAHRVWKSTTSIARLDWIHWIVSAKQAKTREKRMKDACEMLAEGKKRLCCFDPSGYYSKAFKVPEVEG